MLHIIIPVFNRLNETKLCIKALESQSYKNYKIYIVDDGSTDGTETYLKENHKDINIIRGDGNLWWTGSMKVGVEHVLALQKNNEDQYLMSLNQDVQLEKEALRELMEVASLDNNTLVSAISVDTAKDHRALSSGSKTLSWILNLNYHPHYNQPYSDISLDNINLDIFIGRSCVYPIEVFRRIGNFDSNNFPQYGGDSEFSCRAKKKGFNLMLVPKAIAYTEKESTGLNPDYRRLSYREIVESFTSIRSTNNLRKRTKFALKIVPKYALPTYLIIMYIKILIQTISTFFIPKK